MTGARHWRREGLLLAARPDHPLINRTYVPTVLPLGDDLWRIYFAGCDRDNLSRVLAVDVDPTRHMQVVAEHFEPLLELGQIGAFDFSGTIPSCALRVQDQVWLYYFGAHLRKEVRAGTAIGLAVSDDGLTFRRAYEGPVLGPGPLDPFLTASPCVVAGAGGYRMWYVSGMPWIRAQAGVQLDPTCGIRMALSADGRLWSPDTMAVIDPLEPRAVGLARPWIADSPDGLQLWYSRRGSDYREGGESPYRMAHVRIDAASGRVTGTPLAVHFENPPQPGDFDDWMQAYSCVLPSGPDLIMLYNGNGFGRTGIGWARLPGGAGG